EHAEVDDRDGRAEQRGTDVRSGDRARWGPLTMRESKVNTRNWRMQGRAFVILLAALFGTACSDDVIGPKDSRVRELTLTASATGVVDAFGEAVEVTVHAVDARGRKVKDVLIEWSYAGEALAPESAPEEGEALVSRADQPVRFVSVANGTTDIIARV